MPEIKRRDLVPAAAYLPTRFVLPCVYGAAFSSPLAAYFLLT